MKLLDLRPCDSCNGPIKSTFSVVRTSIATIHPAKANQVMASLVMFGGNVELAEVMSDANCVTVAMDDPEFKSLMVELLICNDCMCKPIVLGEVCERRNERKKA